MGLTLAFLVFSLLVGLIALPLTYSKKDMLINGVMAFVISAVVLGMIGTIGVIGTSYSRYLDNKGFYDATIEQYRGAVEMYKDYAVIDVEKAAFTDFKYQKYQEQLSSMIITLRNRITEYNRIFIKKRELKKNWFFNWYIIDNSPNMKIIRMIEKHADGGN